MDIYSLILGTWNEKVCVSFWGHLLDVCIFCCLRGVKLIKLYHITSSDITATTVKPIPSQVASLRKSTKNSMLILWDHTWGQRLWCIFELAAYLKCHGDERNQNESLESTSSRRWTWRRRPTTFEVERSLMILPVFWGRYVQRIFLGCCLFMMSAVFISYDFAIWRMLIYAAILLVVVVLAHWGVVGYFRELDVPFFKKRHWNEYFWYPPKQEYLEMYGLLNEVGNVHDQALSVPGRYNTFPRKTWDNHCT